MSHANDLPTAGTPAAPAAPAGPVVSLEDPRVVRAVHDYLAALEAGGRPSRSEVLRRYPAVAAGLAECLDALEFVHQVNPLLDAPAAEPTHPELPLGDYRIVREIGRGGMGVVYEAVQLSLGRRVALKVLPFAATLDPRQLLRFKNEAQAAAHLHHTNIVPVFAVGCERGVHFYAMQFIEGQTLAALVHELRGRDVRRGEDKGRSTKDERMTKTQAPMTRGTPLGLRRSTLDVLSSFELRASSFFRAVAELGIQAAEALDYAHRQEIIHRDVKPANLLLDVQGNLWITDFGLARCQTDAGLTMTGDVMGTLRYMSPEQASGQRTSIDGRTDVYSLGATLYELLTLEPAFAGHDRRELLHRIAEEDPRPPRQHSKTIPAELETIVLKALAKSPDERYATARELAQDLRRFLDHQPIHARRPTRWQRVKKWARRHRPLVIAAAVATGLFLFLAMAALAVTTLVIAREQQQTEQALAAEQQAREDMERLLYYHRIALAERGRTDPEGGGGRVEDWLEWCPPRLRGWEWHYLKRRAFAEPLAFSGGLHFAFHPNSRFLAAPQGRHVRVWDTNTGQEVFTCRGHTGAVACVAYSPDGRLLASAGEDATIYLWNAATGRERGALRGHTEPVLDLAFHPDGRRLMSWSVDRTIRVWNANTAQELFRVSWPAKDVGPLGSQSAGVCFSPDGNFLVSGGEDHTVKFWDAETGHERRTLRGHHKPVKHVQFTARGDRLLSISRGGQLKVWDVSTGQELFTAQSHVPYPRRNLAFSPDGHLLAVGSSKHNFQVLDAETGQVMQTLRGHAASVFALAFSPDGRRLASGSGDGTVRLWDTTGQEAITLRGHRIGVERVVFSPDGRRLASASTTDGKIRVHDSTSYEDPPHVLTLPGHSDHVHGLAFSPDGRQLASAGYDGVVKVRNASTGKPLLTLRGHTDAVLSVAFSPDGRLLASYAKDRSVQIRDAATGEEPRTFAGCGSGVWNLALSPDGRHFAVIQDGAVKIRQVATGEEVRTLRAPIQDISIIAYSPDGRRLASGSQAATVFIWDTGSGQLLHALRGHSTRAKAVAFSPDGHRLASCGAENVVFIWDVATGKKFKALSGRPRGFITVTWSPDGRWIAGGSLGGMISVWDVEAGREVATRRALPGQVWHVAFSPDSRRLAVGGGYEGWGGVKIWPVPFWEDGQAEGSASNPLIQDPGKAVGSVAAGLQPAVGGP